MFYDLEKLTNVEETLTHNLSKADKVTFEKDYDPQWYSYCYRHDIKMCLMVIREYKEVLRQLKMREEK